MTGRMGHLSLNAGIMYDFRCAPLLNSSENKGIGNSVLNDRLIL